MISIGAVHVAPMSARARDPGPHGGSHAACRRVGAERRKASRTTR